MSPNNTLHSNRYSNEPIKAEVIRDFLPSPEQLVAGGEGVSVRSRHSRLSGD
jgi:hypothetical protein